MGHLKELTKGFIKENPVLVLLLGTCPTLAVSTMAQNGLGMGVAATLVLLGSNIVISLLKKVIPDKVRIPCYIVIIAGFVTIVQFIVKAYAPSIDSALGIYLPLIVVNCIILGRAEMFASKRSVLDSALDGLGMGIGFTIALLLIGSIREILGAGTWFGLRIIPESVSPIAMIGLPPGGFLIFGVAVALANWASKGKILQRKSAGCAGCPSNGTCAGDCEGKGENA
ncbi:MAG: electron transport complex subunit E [Provencibacterium sp.]|jgi:electron transport complex protein RnfE|nr:electron transport complex subunit E [Provencibacterium sp.]